MIFFIGRSYVWLSVQIFHRSNCRPSKCETIFKKCISSSWKINNSWMGRKSRCCLLHTCQLSLFKRGSPYFDPRKIFEKKISIFIRFPYFCKNLPVVMYRKLGNVLIFKDNFTICPYWVILWRMNQIRKKWNLLFIFLSCIFMKSNTWSFMNYIFYFELRRHTC